MRISFFSALCATILSPGIAAANCPTGAQELLSCTLKNGSKTLTTCLDGQTATYAFAAPNQPPELHLARHVRDVDYTPWPGIGRTIWEEFSFQNNDVRYLVHYSIDKTPGAVLQGGVTVMQGDKELARLSCDAGSVTGAGYGMHLYQAKERAGQVFSMQSRIWVDK